MNPTLEAPKVPLNDKRTINAWAIFDWANSSFALVITVAIFPAYFTSITNETIYFGDYGMSNNTVYAYCISASYLIIALFSPLLSGIADYGGKKKFFLKMFTTIGSLACISLFFFKGMDQLFWGITGFILAMIGFAGGFVFYNAYLPEIVTEDRYDTVSAKGYSYGFIGSVILLILNMVVILNPGWFGIPEDSTLGVRIAFIMVGVWWIGFAQIPFKILPDDPKGKPQTNLVKKGMEELRKVWKIVKNQRYIKFFLYSFFFYNAGVQTVLYMASTFASEELKFGQGELIGIVLLLQIVAIGGAYLFSYISGLRGNKFSLIVMLVIWAIICLAAYLLNSQSQFYIVAAAVGMVMGGTQSLSRATYSKLIPENTDDTTSYFSFYDVLEKVATVFGTFIFGIMNQLTGSMRLSVLAMAIIFVISITLLSRVKIIPAKPGEVVA